MKKQCTLCSGFDAWQGCYLCMAPLFSSSSSSSPSPPPLPFFFFFGGGAVVMGGGVLSASSLFCLSACFVLSNGF